MNDYKQYLPSRKFIATLLFIIAVIAVFFTIKGVISFIKSGRVNKNTPTTVVVGDIIQKDSNDNGIPDWEEYLWGLNPDKDGKKNKEFILAKKKSLEESGVITASDDSQSISENEILSRQFFATITSLQQTGNISPESLQSISSAIGQKIEVNQIPNVYSKNDLIISSDSAKANEAYFMAFDQLVTKYENADIGRELTLVSQGIGNNDPQALDAAASVASAYRSFGMDLTKIPVPNSAYSIHLDLANNYEKTAQSIEGLTKTLTDPIIGMRAILSYKQYSDALVSDIEKLGEILQ